MSYAHKPAEVATAQPRQVTVHVVDDDQDVRQALSRLLSGLECRVRTHSSAEEFRAAYSEHEPECLVLDIQLQGMSGLHLLADLATQSANLPTIVISGHADTARVVAAMRGGAVDFLEKPLQPERLLEQVQAAIGQAAAAAEERRSLAALRAAFARLTRRERKVFELLGRGLTAKQIAHELGMSIRTAHIHRNHVLIKFRTENQIDLVRAAERLASAARRPRA